MTFALRLCFVVFHYFHCGNSNIGFVLIVHESYGSVTSLVTAYSKLQSISDATATRVGTKYRGIRGHDLKIYALMLESVSSRYVQDF